MIERDFLDYSASKLTQYVERIGICLSKLDEDGIWFRGCENENSIGNLCLHLEGNVRQWILCGVGGAADSRDRDAEFAASGGWDGGALGDRLRSTVEAASALIAALPVVRLSEPITIQGYEMTVCSAILSCGRAFFASYGPDPFRHEGAEGRGSRLPPAFGWASGASRAFREDPVGPPAAGPQGIRFGADTDRRVTITSARSSVLARSSVARPAPLSAPAASRATAASRLTNAQRAQVASLSATDRKVRAHEQAHLTVAGPSATGGPTYTFAKGPDGNLYAVGGEVSLNVSPDPSDPKKTLDKARIIEAAADAPVDPSAQDRAVAGMAAQMAQTAEQQIALQSAARQSAERSHPGSSAYLPRTTIDPGSLLSLIA